MYKKCSVETGSTLYKLETCFFEYDNELRDINPNSFILLNKDTNKEYLTKTTKLFNPITGTTYLNVYNLEPVPTGNYKIYQNPSIKIINKSGKIQTEPSIELILETGITEEKIQAFPVKESDLIPEINLTSSLKSKEEINEPIPLSLTKKSEPEPEPEPEEEKVIYPSLFSLRSRMAVPTNIKTTNIIIGDETAPNPDIPMDPVVDGEEEIVKPEVSSYIERTVGNIIYFKFDKSVIDYRSGLINLTAHGKHLRDSYKYNLSTEDGLLKLEIENPKFDLLVSMIVGQGALTFNDTSKNSSIVPVYGMFNIRMDYISYFEVYISQYFGIEISKKITTILVMILARAEAIAPLHDLRPGDIIDLIMCVAQATNSPFRDGIMSVNFTALKYLSSAAIGSLSASWDINTAQIKLLELAGPTMMHDYRHCFSLIEGHTFLDDKNLVHTSFETIYGENIQEDTMNRINAEKSDDKWVAYTSKWKIY